MRIEKLLDKLQPLMPENVQRWRRIRETADDNLRALLDRQVVNTAHQVLGDFDSKLLLSLPSERVARGAFSLGTIIYEKPKWQVGINSGELLQNLALFGRSGAGKTNVAFHILRQLADQKIPFLFLDWKRTARHLLPALKCKVNLYTPGRSFAPLPFNPFQIPLGIENSVYVKHVVDALADAYTLGDGAKRIVQKALVACYAETSDAPSVKTVLNKVEAMEAKSRALAWKVSALRALEALAFTTPNATHSSSQRELAERMLKDSTIIELDSLDQNSKSFLLPLLCFWLYSVKLVSGQREKLGLAVFIEEAHHLLFHNEHRAKETLMNQLLRQGREVGMSFVVIDQNPSQISRAALNNTFTTICLNLKDTSDINKAAGLCLLDEDEKKWFSMMPVGQGIVKMQDRWRRPFLAQFPHIPVNKGYMTDARLRAFLDDNTSPRELQAMRREAIQAARMRGTSGRYLSLDEFRLLHDVIRFPDSPVRERYQRLGVGANKGHTIKERLVNQGWLDEEIVETGQTRMMRLRAPDDAAKALGSTISQIPTTHLVHEYWKRFYAAKLRDEGYEVQMEALRVNGRVDVLGVKDGRTLAVEVETGKSDVVKNVKSCLLSGFDKIIIGVVDKTAMNTLTNKLARSGLHSSPRVTLLDLHE